MPCEQTHRSCGNGLAGGDALADFGDVRVDDDLAVCLYDQPAITGAALELGRWRRRRRVSAGPAETKGNGGVRVKNHAPMDSNGSP